MTSPSAIPDTESLAPAVLAERELAELDAKRQTRGWATFNEATRRLQLQRQQQLAHEEAERHTEGRIYHEAESMAARNPHD